MPLIGDNFIYSSMNPNFDRDRYANRSEMTRVKTTDLDKGHIVYCEEDNAHYIFKGVNFDWNTFNFDECWEKLQAKEELVFWEVEITRENGLPLITEDVPIQINTTLGERKWNELKAISASNQLLVLVTNLTYTKTSNGDTSTSSKAMIPCTIRDGGAIIWINGSTNLEGSEIELTCLQDRTGTNNPNEYKIIANGFIYYHAKSTISDDDINALN